MKKNNLIIIGAGITGLMSAFFLRTKNNHIKVYEISKNAGGISKDLTNEKENYLSGCQFYINNSFWVNFLPKNIKNKLILSNISAHSYCDLFNKKINFIRNYPDIFTDFQISFLKLKKKKFKNLLERINFYPEEISKPLLKWVRRFNIKPNLLIDTSHRQGLMFSRLYCVHQYDQLIKIKEKNTIIDDTFGVPKFNKKNLFFEGLLPIDGFTDFFLTLQKELEKREIEFNFSSPVSTKWDGLKLAIKNKGQIINCENILWTGNPVPLINNLNKKKLDSMYFKIRALNVMVKGYAKDPFYIQVFSSKSSLCRIFVYKKKEQFYACLECLDEAEKSAEIIQFANRILKYYNDSISLDNLVLVDEIRKRFSLVTNRDKRLLNSFKTKIKKSNLIPSPWEIYSRDDKIKYLYQKLKKYF